MPNRLAHCLQKSYGKTEIAPKTDVSAAKSIPILDHLMKRGLLAEASRKVVAQNMTPHQAELATVIEMRDKALADEAKVRAALKGKPAPPAAQASTRRPVDRDASAKAAIERMHATPEESFEVTRQILPAYERVRAKTKQMQEAIPPPLPVDEEAQLEEVDAIETKAEEDLDAELEAARQKVSDSVAAQYADRISRATDPVQRRFSEQLAETARVNRLRGVEKQFVEKRKALSAKFSRQRQVIKAKARDVALRSTEEGQRMHEDIERVRAFSELNAIVSVLPREVRERIGGTVTLASLRGTGRAISDFMVSRIEKIDVELQRHFREVYRNRIETLLKQAKPTGKAGQRPKGKIGFEAQRIVGKINAVMAMSPVTSEEEKNKIVKALEEAEAGDTARISELTEDLQIIEIFGALNALNDVSTLERAYNYLRDVYTTGRGKQKSIDAERIANVKAMRDAAVSDTGKTGLYSELDAKMEKDGHLLSKILGTAGPSASLMSFEQVVHVALGKDSDLGKQLVAREREAKLAKRRGLLQIEKEWKDVLARVFPEAKSPLKREQARWRMQQKDPKDGGITVQLAKEAVRLSQMEAIHMSMLWAQERYQPAMSEHGWTEDTMKELEGKLTVEAKGVREFFASKYQTSHAPVSAVFRRMYGMDLPQEANYAPGLFEHEGEDQDMDPYGHGLIPEGGMAAGFLKARKEHKARPRIEDALSVFLSHTAQTEHWKAYAELVRDMQSVFNNVEVKRAIRAKAGENVTTTLAGWVKAFQRNGVKERSFIKGMDEWLRRYQSVTARLSLAWNISTLMKQSTAMFSSLADIPGWAYTKGLAKLMTGQLETQKIWNSRAIQDRIASGYSPEARMALEQMFNAAPNISSEMVEKGMKMIGNVDAIFTTWSAAISYDYHYNEALKSGMDPVAAEQAAMSAMEATVARTAQPAEMSDRSLWELGLSPAGRSIFMFMSEARQKLMLEYAAYRNVFTGEEPVGDRIKEAARVFFLSRVITPAIMYAVTSMWRDIRDDDDDEWFDWDSWSPWNFLMLMVGGNFAAVPLLASMFSTEIFKLPSQFAQFEQEVMRTFKDGWPDDSEKQVKALKRFLGGVSWSMAMLGFPTGAAINILGKTGEDLIRVIDNFSGYPDD